MTTELDDNILNFLQGFCSEIVYQKDEFVIYEGHVPRVGFVLLEGKIEIHMSKTKKEVPQRSGVALKEVANMQPFKYSVKIYPNTKVLPLDRSTLRKLAQVDDANIRDFANSMLLTA